MRKWGLQPRARYHSPMSQSRRAVADRPKPRRTYEEYLRDPEIDEHTEWVDGEVIQMMSVSRAHADLQSYLMRLLGIYVESMEAGKVYAEPFNMKTGPTLAGRAPDVIVVLTANLERVQDQYLKGPADLVVEIISPGTESVDRGDKFLEYERGGVREYWILDPHREIADFYVRDESGIFRTPELSGPSVFGSTVLPGFRLPIDALWSLPPVPQVLRDMGVAL
jgi:Uma2 family endonuclease